MNVDVQFWGTSKLVPYSSSLRKNDDVVERMAASIREYGFKIPILARSNGEVVDGHLRLKAAQKLGLETVPVILCDEWTPQQVKAFRLMANRSATWADWDLELVAVEMAQLHAINFDLSLTGFEPAEIDDLLFCNLEPNPDDVAPEPPAEPVTQPGDLWVCGSHRVHCADATSAIAVARVLGSASPVLMVTDPPYGVEYDPNWRERAGLGASNRAG